MVSAQRRNEWVDRACTKTPEQITADDVLALRRAGLDDEQIMDAVHVAVLLEICTGVVDVLDVESAC